MSVLEINKLRMALIRSRRNEEVKDTLFLDLAERLRCKLLELKFVELEQDYENKETRVYQTNARPTWRSAARM